MTASDQPTGFLIGEFTPRTTAHRRASPVKALVANGWLVIHRATENRRSVSVSHACGLGIATEIALDSAIELAQELLALFPDGKPSRAKVGASTEAKELAMLYREGPRQETA